MRIIAGSVRGRVLKGPKSAVTIRPTADRVRESVFNLLGQRCDGMTVLDLFAGTGALAFEALSRGASRAVLVDCGKEAQQLCQHNAQSLGFTAQIEVLPLSAQSGIAKLSARQERFELIFADPPYAEAAVEKLLGWLTTHRLLTLGGRLVFEHSKHQSVPEVVGAFTRIDQRIFGETRVSIFTSTS